MKIYRCVKTNWISQTWGDSRACISLANGSIIGKRNGTCPVGYTSFYEYIGLKYHNGIDFAAYLNEKVYYAADFDGWMRTEVDSAGGIGVDIVSTEPILKCTEPNCEVKHYVKTRYWHNNHITWQGVKLIITSRVKKYLDIKVKMGNQIALAGSTGKSSGPHVHFATKWCDEHGNGIHRNNGTFGAFDPRPYFENIFVVDQVKKEELEAKVIETQLTLIDVLRQYVTLLQIQLKKLKQEVGSFLG